MKKHFHSIFHLRCVGIITGLQQPLAIRCIYTTSEQVRRLVTIRGSKLNQPTSATIGGVSAISISFENARVIGMIMPGATTSIESVSRWHYGAVNGSNNSIVKASTPPNKQLLY